MLALRTPAATIGRHRRGCEGMLRAGRWLSRAFCSTARRIPDDGLELHHFVSSRHVGAIGKVAPVKGDACAGNGAKYHLETYGCQMNTADSELVRGILDGAGFSEVGVAEEADVLLINTCSIREKAEEKVKHRLARIRRLGTRRKKQDRPVVCVLGCMAERLKKRLLEEMDLADVIAGPDAYRDLPRLVSAVRDGDVGCKAYNVQLSTEETYADLTPVRATGSGVSAFVSIMRGCSNMCTYCIVPFTRGRERSRPFDSILREVAGLVEAGYKEVVLLGQNVNSYNDTSAGVLDTSVTYAAGFQTVYRPPRSGRRFAELVDAICRLDSSLRVRYTSPHPKDFCDDLIALYREHPNLGAHVHLPLQSGSSSVLERMRRGYTGAAFEGLVSKLREARPDLAISTDIICGFCGETEEEHQETLRVIDAVQFEYAYVFAYSERERTFASRHLTDDVARETKVRRVNEVNRAWRTTALARNSTRENTVQHVLVEGPSKSGSDEMTGRTDSNTRAVILPDATIPIHKGHIVPVQVIRATQTTLYCHPLPPS